MRFKELNNKSQATTFSRSLKKSSCNFQTLFSTWIMEECTENFTMILKKKYLWNFTHISIQSINHPVKVFGPLTITSYIQNT